MKRVVGIAIGFTLSGSIALAGGSIGGMGVSMHYDAQTHTIYVPGGLAPWIVIKRQSTRSNTSANSLEANNFDLLQDLADSRRSISAQDENNSGGSYLVRSGDAMDELKLIDRRNEIRNGKAQ